MELEKKKRLDTYASISKRNKGPELKKNYGKNS